MPPNTRVPPCAAIPLRIAPMPCSRIPKWSTRPASGSPFHIADERSFGRNDAAFSIVVLLDSARSAEPPQSSGTASATALITAPDALRVAMPFSSAGNVGRVSVQPSGRVRVCSRSNRSWLPEGFFAQRVELVLPRRLRGLAALDQADGCARGPRSGSRRSAPGRSRGPSWSPRPRPPRAPSRVPCRCSARRGAGQAMIVRSTIRLGWSVTPSALRIASYSAGTSSRYCPAAVGPVDDLDVPAVGLVALRRRPR